MSFPFEIWLNKNESVSIWPYTVLQNKRSSNFLEKETFRNAMNISQVDL